MGLFAPKFFGMSVRGAQCSLGLGQQASSLSVRMVPDFLGGDVPDVPPVGSPCSFAWGAFLFEGLLQRYAATDGPDGLGLAEATIVDPRDLLDGCECVTWGYSGGTMGVPNLLNPFGYFEGGVSFGKSLATANGMPWSKFAQGVTELTAGPAGPFGGPLLYMGHAYAVDLSALPVPPAAYRVPAGKVGLLEAVIRLCEDAGCDFFVRLDGPLVRVVPLSRRLPASPGAIARAAAAAEAEGVVARAEAGVECLHEPTSAFLVGGPKTSVFLSGGLVSYWGRAIDDTPVIGLPGAHPGVAGLVDYAALNALDCADIVGSPSYVVNEVEILAALKGPEAWGAYIDAYKKPLSVVVGAGLYAAPPLAPDLPAVLKQDVVNDDPAAVSRAVNAALTDRRERLYDLVRRAAEDYYGRQYLVQVPFVLARQDPDTLAIETDLEPAAAGHLRFGAEDVGVPPLDADALQEADGRVLPFAYFPSVVGADAGRLSPSDSVVGPAGDGWVRCQVGQRVLVLTGPLQIPVVHVTLGAALYDAEPFGGPDGANIDFGGDPAGPNVRAIEANAAAGGTLGHAGFHPRARRPAAVGVPMKSNRECYGPWVAAGPPGRVRFEQDDGLTPWNYGGEAAMDAAGAARVEGAAAAALTAESGSLTVAGPPTRNPGDRLYDNGPAVAAVDVSYGPDGVTTTYRFQGSTPRFGTFSRDNAERLRRASLAAAEARRELRRALNKDLVGQSVLAAAGRGAAANRAFWLRRQSPHTVLIGQNVKNGTEVRPGAGAETYESALAIVADAKYAEKALMSLSGLVRPFTTNPSAAAPLAHYETPTVPAGFACVANTTLDPFRTGHDIELLAWGQAFAGTHARRRGATAADTRAMALRGPLVVTGWGPGAEGGGVTYPAVSNLLRRADAWKTGAVDLAWDDVRKVWTSRDVVTGTLPAAVAAGATGTLRVGGSTGWTLTVLNPWSGSVAAGKVVASFALNLNAWVITAADCTT
jgi:hypothetical protein